jgi:hypothetical protein
MDQAKALPSHGTWSASQCPNPHVLLVEARTEAPDDLPQSERLRRLDETLREPRFRLFVGRGCRDVDQSEYSSTARYHMVWEMTMSSSAGRKMVAYRLFYPF